MFSLRLSRAFELMTRVKLSLEPLGPLNEAYSGDGERAKALDRANTCTEIFYLSFKYSK